ncbi:DNA internalization-related competence protein ComEC/Rec2 [Heyndrickxia ginsengihumi]|uniref:DNA internalization-related competence protein ComEC/Rec2 n=1 Tax=Heyndrickxia ginsengihumi TaxID=363870 RepID=UPI003D2506F3
MKGYWLFIALTGLCGALVILPTPFLIVIFFHVIWLRIFLLKSKKILFFAVLSYSLGMIAGLVQEHSVQTKHKQSENRFMITFPDYPKVDGDHIKAFVISNKERFMFQYYAASEDEKLLFADKIVPGTVCYADGKLTLPEANRNPETFNYRSYLYTQHIHWLLTVNHLHQCVQPSKNDRWKYFLLFVRHHELMKIEKTFPPRTVPYVEALLFGNQDHFNDNTYSLYQRLGIIHLLAISGLHVNMIAGALFLVLIRSGMTREASFKCLMVALPIYAIICGLSPPVVRAVMMTLLLLISTQARLPLTPLDALSISFLLYLLIDAFIIFNIGFQLSYAVCYAIILSSKTIIANDKHLINRMLKITFISQIAAIPIMIYHFYEFSLIAFISNLFFVPFYSYIMLPFSILSYVASYVLFPVFPLCSNMLFHTIVLAEAIAKWMDTSWSVLLIGRPPIAILLLISITILFLLISIEKRRSFLKSMLPLACLLVLIIVANHYSLFGKIIFIDVGQGDSILIKLPWNRGTYLIDTGGELSFKKEQWQQQTNPFEVGKDVLVPFLKSQGIGTIDKLILTHSDEDHIGGAEAIISSLHIKEIDISPRSWEKTLMKEIIAEAQMKHIPVFEMMSGDHWQNKAGSFVYVSPFDDHYEGNNDSLVLYANVGGKKWLFTGDLEKEGEETLIRAFHFHVDILKVGHHGSKTSTSEAFLNQLSPSIAVISVGKHNRFGHPNKEVIERLKAHHIVIYRTDEQGAITYRFFKNTGTFTTCLP